MPAVNPVTSTALTPGNPSTLGTVTPSASAMTSVSVTGSSAVASQASVTLTISASTDGVNFYQVLSGVIPALAAWSSSNHHLGSVDLQAHLRSSRSPVRPEDRQAPHHDLRPDTVAEIWSVRPDIDLLN